MIHITPRILALLYLLCWANTSSAQMLIALDPGHGGSESGAQKGILREADIALDIAVRMKRHLLQHDFNVVMTREDNSTVGLLKRTEIANDAKADVFISIHVNAAESSTLHGIETYSVDIATDGYSEMLAMKENSGILLDKADIPTISTSIVRPYRRSLCSIIMTITPRIPFLSINKKSCCA